MRLITCFNPRPRMEGDSIPTGRHVDRSLFQSAPPHGGRQPPPVVRSSFCVFQSAPPHGGRHDGTVDVDVWDWFQSAPPHGGRPPARQPCNRGPSCFNPRPRMEGDRTADPNRPDRTGFNPRPRMEGDRRICGRAPRSVAFQSAPPHGGRPVMSQQPASLRLVSIRAPAWRATRCS